jgi:DNA polymerase V
VEARGDSMIDAGITDRDILIVDTTLDYRENDIVICSLNNFYMAKIIKRLQNKLFLMSKNPNFDPVEIQESDDFRVFGVVKGLSRKFR